MQYTFVLAAFASLAAAQTLTTSTTSAAAATSSTTCAAQDILDACIATIKGQINSCSTSDYSCLCQNYGNLLTCYNNCPEDTGVSSVQSQREQYCSAASVYGSTTTYGTVASTAHSASATNSGAGIGGTATQTGFASVTSNGNSASSTSSGNGAAPLEVAGGLLAVVAAGFGLLM